MNEIIIFTGSFLGAFIGTLIAFYWIKNPIKIEDLKNLHEVLPSYLKGKQNVEYLPPLTPEEFNMMNNEMDSVFDKLKIPRIKKK